MGSDELRVRDGGGGRTEGEYLDGDSRRRDRDRRVEREESWERPEDGHGWNVARLAELAFFDARMAYERSPRKEKESVPVPPASFALLTSRSGGRPIRALRPSFQAPRRLPRRLRSQLSKPLLLLWFFPLPSSPPLLPLDHQLPSHDLPNFHHDFPTPLHAASHTTDPDPVAARRSASHLLQFGPYPGAGEEFERGLAGECGELDGERMVEGAGGRDGEDGRDGGWVGEDVVGLATRREADVVCLLDSHVLLCRL